MEAPQQAPHILLTKCALLVLCVHLCAAIDHHSVYSAELKTEDVATTMSMSRICECHNACRVMVNCTAATYVIERNGIPNCHISETPGIAKTDLERPNANTHITIIKGYQVNFVEEQSLIFTAAKQACLDMGMRLATPSDAASLDLLWKIHKERYPKGRETWNYWADITKTDDNKWVWGDGVEVTAEVGVDPWGPGQPTGTGKCGKMSVEYNLRLKDWDCDNIRRFVCTL